MAISYEIFKQSESEFLSQGIYQNLLSHNEDFLRIKIR